MPTTTAADGTAVAYEVDGSGPFLLFVHGLLEDRSTWDPIVDRLRSDHTCARLDLRGLGESGAAADYLATTQAGDLAAVVAAVGAPDPPLVVGHSLGGVLATMYAATAPVPVRAVVNIDQSLRLAELAQLLRPFAKDLRGPGFRDLLAARFESLGLDRLDPETHERLDRIHERGPQEFVLGAWHPLLEWTDDQIIAFVETEVLPSVRVPYLAIHGADPPADYVDWLTARVPTATVEVWGGGHWVHLADPDRFVARVREFAL